VLLPTTRVLRECPDKSAGVLQDKIDDVSAVVIPLPGYRMGEPVECHPGLPNVVRTPAPTKNSIANSGDVGHVILSLPVSDYFRWNEVGHFPTPLSCLLPNLPPTLPPPPHTHPPIILLFNISTKAKLHRQNQKSVSIEESSSLSSQSSSASNKVGPFGNKLTPLSVYFRFLVLYRTFLSKERKLDGGASLVRPVYVPRFLPWCLLDSVRLF
jgi:hypothetical protein